MDFTSCDNKSSPNMGRDVNLRDSAARSNGANKKAISFMIDSFAKKLST